LVHSDTDEREQIVTLDPREILRASAPLRGGGGPSAEARSAEHVDVSRELALVLLFLFALELGLRALGRRGAPRTLPDLPAPNAEKQSA
jgi:hypothetical protein